VTKSPFYDEMTPEEQRRFDEAMEYMLACAKRDLDPNRPGPFDGLVPSKVKGPKYLIPERKR